MSHRGISPGDPCSSSSLNSNLSVIQNQYFKETFKPKKQTLFHQAYHHQGNYKIINQDQSVDKRITKDEHPTAMENNSHFFFFIPYQYCNLTPDALIDTRI
jgi:hypothetical protein